MRNAYTLTAVTNPGRVIEIKCFDSQIEDASSAGLIALGICTGSDPVAGNPWTGFSCINLMRQGATIFNRIGNKVVVKSIQVRCGLNLYSGVPSSIIRAALIYDRQPNGAYPAIGEIFADTTGVTNRWAPLNIANRSRFRFNLLFRFLGYNESFKWFKRYKYFSIDWW